MSRWRREGAWLFGANLAQQAAGVLVLVWLARNIDVPDWGRFALDAAGLGLLASLGTCRLNVLVVRTSAEAWSDSLARRAAAAMRSEALLLLLVGLVAFALLGRLSTSTLLLATGLAARHLAQQLRSFSERRGRYAPLARLETLVAFGGHGAAVAAVLLRRPELALYLRESFLGLALLGLVTLDLRAARLLPVAPWLAGPRTFLSLLQGARPAWFDGVAEQAFDRVVVLLAGALGGSHGAGIFAQARGLAFRPHQLLAPLASRLGLGWLSQKAAGEERRAATFRIAGRIAPFTIASGLVTALASTTVVPWLLGERWAAAGVTLAWLGGFVAAITLQELGKTALVVDGKLRALVRVRFVQALCFGLSVGAAFLLELRGPEALGLALSVTTLVTTLLIYREVARSTG